jgi:hypothetical protein
MTYINTKARLERVNGREQQRRKKEKKREEGQEERDIL